MYHALPICLSHSTTLPNSCLHFSMFAVTWPSSAFCPQQTWQLPQHGVIDGNTDDSLEERCKSNDQAAETSMSIQQADTMLNMRDSGTKIGQDMKDDNENKDDNTALQMVKSRSWKMEHS